MNVPKLRFSGFNEEWEYKTFDELIDIKSSSYNPNNNSDNYKCIELEHINQNSGTINGFCNSAEQKSNKNIFKKNDVLFGKLRPYLKKYWYATFDGVCSSEIWVAKSKDNNKIINKFIFDLFQSHYFIQLCNLSTGSKMPRADWSFIKEQSVAIPLITEQEKITNILSLLDKKIELQTKKIEALKLFKLYIRKKIFSSNTNNNIRLKEIVNCESSNITLADIENDNGIYPVYGATGFIKNIKNYKFDSEYIAIVKDGAGVGRTMICPKNSSILATMNALTIKNNYPLNYICEMINTISFDKYIVGSGIPHIYFKDYGNEEFMLHNENDANKFDSVFKCLDRKIELLNVSLDKLNILKKGLMQGMFV